MTTDQDMTPEEQATYDKDMQRAAQGFITEHERWTAMLIEFANTKISPDDLDWIKFKELIKTLHLDSGKNHKEPGKIFHLIARNRAGRDGVERPGVGRYLTKTGTPVVLHHDCAQNRFRDSRSVRPIGPAYTTERCADCEEPAPEPAPPRTFSEEAVRQLLFVIGFHATALGEIYQALGRAARYGVAKRMAVSPELADLLRLARGTWVNAGPYGVGSEDDPDLDVPKKAYY